MTSATTAKSVTWSSTPPFTAWSLTSTLAKKASTASIPKRKPRKPGTSSAAKQISRMYSGRERAGRAAREAHRVAEQQDVEEQLPGEEDGSRAAAAQVGVQEAGAGDEQHRAEQRQRHRGPAGQEAARPGGAGQEGGDQGEAGKVHPAQHAARPGQLGARASGAAPLSGIWVELRRKWRHDRGG